MTLCDRKPHLVRRNLGAGQRARECLETAAVHPNPAVFADPFRTGPYIAVTACDMHREATRVTGIDAPSRRRVPDGMRRRFPGGLHRDGTGIVEPQSPMRDV